MYMYMYSRIKRRLVEKERMAIQKLAKQYNMYNRDEMLNYIHIIITQKHFWNKLNVMYG